MSNNDNQFIWNPYIDDPAEEMVYRAIPAVKNMWHKHHDAAIFAHKTGWTISWKKDIACLLAEVISEAK